MKLASTLLLTLAFLTQVGSAQDQTVPVPELETLKKEYASLVQTVNGPYLAAVAELDKNYIARLEQGQKTAQQAGKLDEALAISVEKKAVSSGSGVPAEDDAKTPGVLRKMHATYRAEIAKLDLARAKNLKPMRDDYAKELDALVTSLTKEGKLEEAVTVRRFRQSLPASPVSAPQVAGPLKPLPSGEVPTTTDTGTSPIVTERSVGPTAKTPVLNNPDNATVRWSCLSDIEEQAATVGFDQFVKGKLTLKDKKITVGGDMPRHGLYAHAPSNITYDLSHQAFVAFKGRVGLIDGSWGEVQFIVVGDGKELWKSPVVKKEREGKNPKMVQFDLNIRGVRELVMKVDPLGSQVSDQSVWVDPQLGK